MREHGEMIKREKPETVPDLKDLVQEKFTALERTNSDLELNSNEKFALFKEQLQQMKTQSGFQNTSSLCILKALLAFPQDRQLQVDDLKLV
ncbi:UNVERIFIED_CONTAM: hypothetical protein K2H54_024071 [Gekko kuhli]